MDNNRPPDNVVEKLDEVFGYIGKRVYLSVAEQLDMLWHDIDEGKLDKNGEWYKAIKKVKDDNPKPENIKELKEELDELLRLENA